MTVCIHSNLKYEQTESHQVGDPRFYEPDLIIFRRCMDCGYVRKTLASTEEECALRLLDIGVVEMTELYKGRRLAEQIRDREDAERKRGA